MSAEVKYQTEVQIKGEHYDVEIFAQVTSGLSATRESPAEPPEVDDIYVYFGEREIGAWLDDETVERIKTEALECVSQIY